MDAGAALDVFRCHLWKFRHPSKIGRFDGCWSEGRGVISFVITARAESPEVLGRTVDELRATTASVDREIIVVDDGSTDGTARELARFGDAIRVIRQGNGGCPAAFNSAFRAARGDFVALCGADDILEPRRLEWQEEAVLRHPEVDVLCGNARLFGRVTGDHPAPPGTGVLDSAALTDALFSANVICAPSVTIRRALFEQLGPFIENFGADDYEYWMRCLRAGARFYYDPRPLVGWRQHESNLSGRSAWMLQCSYEVRRRYADDVADRALVHRMLAADLFGIGRQLVDDGRPRAARRAFRGALRHASGAGPSANLRALCWVMVLSAPDGIREHAGRMFIGLSRALDGSRDVRAALS